MPTPDPLHTALFLIIAFVLAGLAHSAWLRSSISERFQWPLDGGRTFRGRRLLGANKTLRGFVVMVPAAAAAFGLLGGLLRNPAFGVNADIWPLGAGQYVLLGAWCGFGFMAAELPNSFFKRQLDIAPGEPAVGRPAAFIHFLIDRTDSLLGLLAAVSVAVPTPLATWGWMLLLGPAVHWSFSFLLHGLGVKARAA